MTKNFISIVVLTLVAAGMAYSQPPRGKHERAERFHGPFIENFSKASSKFFNFNYRRNGYDYRYYSGHESLSEDGTEIMMFRIDPSDPAGAGKGPEIISKDYTFYGTYSARIRVPKVKDVQPNIGAVVGYFTYNIDPEMGQSEIDFEWLIADPEIIYVGTWTGVRPAHNRVGRVINLKEGIIYDTSYRGEITKEDRSKEISVSGKLTGKQNLPKKITPIEDYDASARFYVYGWDWYPDRLTWWIIHPDTNEKIILWDYEGKVLFPGQPAETGIPVVKSKYRLNFWHTNNWPVETNPNSVEAPAYPYELEIDWMSYKPFNDLNPELKK